MERTVWTDERLDDRFDRIDQRFDEVVAEIRELRRELRAESAERRAESAQMRGELVGTRAALGTEIGDVRNGLQRFMVAAIAAFAAQYAALIVIAVS